MNLEDTLRNDADAAAQWLRDRWASFVGLYSRIIDLEHRAAVVAYNARQAGDVETEQLARAVLDSLVKLQKRHDAIVTQAEGIADTIGLRGYQGLGAVPVAAALAVSALALVVLWFFRAYDNEERKLELLERGVLTPEELVALDPGPAPAMVLGAATGLAKWAVFGLVAYVGWRVLSEGGFLKASAKRLGRARRNPPLHVFHSNPPAELMGEEVFSLTYRHADDGLPYVHEFGPGVELWADPDGSVHLEHRKGRELWRDFEVVA